MEGNRVPGDRPNQMVIEAGKSTSRLVTAENRGGGGGEKRSRSTSEHTKTDEGKGKKWDFFGRKGFDHGERGARKV